MAVKLVVSDTYIAELPLVYDAKGKQVHELKIPLTVSIVSDGQPEDTMSEIEMIRKNATSYRFCGEQGGWWAIRDESTKTWFVGKDGSDAYRTGMDETTALSLAFEACHFGVGSSN